MHMSLFKVFYLSFGFFVLSGCGELKEIWGKQGFSHEPGSIFQVYSQEYCRLRLEGASKDLKVLCGSLKNYLYDSQEKCKKKVVPKMAFFPGRDRGVHLCQPEKKLNLEKKSKLRVVVFGDFGVGQNPSKGFNQYLVGDAMHKVCEDAGGCDFALSMGDNIYPSGVRNVWDAKFVDYFSTPYKDFVDTPVYLTLGNHDYFGNIEAQLEYGLLNSHWNMPARHYPLQGVPEWFKIYALDTQSMVGYAGSKVDANDQNQRVCEHFNSRSSWNILFGHFPAISTGKYGGTKEVARELKAIFEKCPFDLQMAGHEHAQEFITTDTYDVLIQGGGGTKIRGFKGGQEMREANPVDYGFSNYRRQFGVAAHGFTILEATPNELKIKFYDINFWKPNTKGFTKPPRFKDTVFQCTRTKESKACLKKND